jgi:DNA-binding beta-propeller fold protein YncE
MRLMLLLFMATTFYNGHAQKKQAEVVFRIPEKDLIPEGMTYDPAGKNFYVGSIQKRKVIRISTDGKISEFATSLDAGLRVVLGMTVKDQKLYVCNNSPEYDSSEFLSSLHIFDLRSGKFLKQYTLNDGKKHLFNDVVIAGDGTAYITDSDGGAVYHVRASSDTLETLLKPGSVRYPNGITLTPDEKRLIVSTGGGLGLVTVDLESKAIKSIANERYFLIGTDGLYRYKNSLIAVQNVTYPEAILQFICNEDFTSVTSVINRASHVPEFDVPTTGVIVGDYFYFIANSQLLQTIGTKGALKNPDQLKQSVIMRIKLD